MSALLFLLLLEGLAVAHSLKTCDRLPLASLTEGSLDISCPAGKVILGPKVKVGINQRNCTGITADVIAGMNNCHWLPNCEVKPNPLMPMISQDTLCQGKPPTWAELESYECIKESTLNFVCRGEASTCVVYNKSGIVVSHETYPWHYPEVQTICHMTLHRTEGHKLLVRLEDLQLDPENTDNVTFNMIADSKKTELDVQVGSTKTVDDANLEIIFSIGQSTKAGKGFLLRYESIPLDSSTTDITAKENECERDGKKAKTKMKKKKNKGNRRGKKKNKKRKKKNKNKEKKGRKGRGKKRNKGKKKNKPKARGRKKKN